MPVSAPPPSTPSGKIVVLATITAAPGKEERVAELLKIAQTHAQSDAEPKTIYYRVTRGVDAEGKLSNVFRVFEEYADLDGMKAHSAGPPLVALFTAVKTEGITSDIDLAYGEGI